MFFMTQCKSCFNFKKDKLFRLYNVGVERVDKEMDMVKILRNIRYLRILSRLNLKHGDRPKLKYYIKHSQKNLLNLDSDDTSETSMSDDDLDNIDVEYEMIDDNEVNDYLDKKLIYRLINE